MGYYCTVPQCTSLAGKTKNVKFHRFPRDESMADKWNLILKRGKPYTKYSKVCSLHFTQADYNVTTMGQWKTLSKDAVPSQNLPRLNPDGSVMVIRKSRTLKYKEGKDSIEKCEKWGAANLMSPPPCHTPVPLGDHHENNMAYRLQTLSAIASTLAPHVPQMQTADQVQNHIQKVKKDAIMQTDPVNSEEDDSQPNNSYSEAESTYENAEFSANPNYPKETKSTEYSAGVSYQKDAKSQDFSANANYHKDAKSQDFSAGSSYSKDKGTEYTANVNTSYAKEAKSADFSASAGYPKDTKSTEFSAYKDTKETQPQNFNQKDYNQYEKETKTYAEKAEQPKNYTKDEYMPLTNEEYNKEAEKYALERKTHFEKSVLESYHKPEYQKPVPMEYHKQIDNNYQKIPEMYTEYQRPNEYYNGYPDSVEVLRNQQHNIEVLQQQHRVTESVLQQQHRVTENQNFFNENQIKLEIDSVSDEDKFMYDRTKEQLDARSYEQQRILQQQRLLEHLQHQLKQEPETSTCEAMQPQGNPYYTTNGHNNVPGYYSGARPGPELLIAKQNALAAHSQLWQNTMKRPFFYSEGSYTPPPLLHRYEDLTRILQ